jgi:signal transduction histidine kinase
MPDRVGAAIIRQRPFLAAASHDLSTPLTAPQTDLELADRPESGPDERRATSGGRD